MTGGLPPQVFFLTSLALVVGLMAFVRGLLEYRRGVRVSSIRTSVVAGLAAGEVRLTGTIEPLVAALVSPLQGKPAVWYQASIVEDGRDSRTVMHEERAVEFGLRDETGVVRVVPRGASWVVPAAFSESTRRGADEPAGLQRRVDTAADATSVAVDPSSASSAGTAIDSTSALGETSGSLASKLRAMLDGKREYQEARLEPGQMVTVVGFAMPPGELSVEGGVVAAADAVEGVERVYSADTVDAAAVDDGAAPPEQLVISSGPQGGLVVYAGDPSQARGRHDQNFMLGLGGAIMAGSAAVVLIVLVNGSM